MRLVLVSGRSGSGKSTALHALEDLGFTCIDNLPVALLPSLFGELDAVRGQLEPNLQVAVGIDARSLFGKLDQIPEILQKLRSSGVEFDVIYLDAQTPTLLKRFSETRRNHPLSSSLVDLREALALEKSLLEPIASVATRRIDTTDKNLHQLREQIKVQVAPDTAGELSVLFESFGFKHGVPLEADFVFDVRCLPNPFWIPELRPFSGNDYSVVEYLEEQPEVEELLTDIRTFLDRWIPRFAASNRSYLTVAIGCTGGQHRSVYISNRLHEHFSEGRYPAMVRHRELGHVNQP